MRVVAGIAGGIPLHPPPESVRPTMDRVREAVFSSLGEAVPGSRILDLFAGSGSLGIEALSRGARSVTFVDHLKDCTLVIRKNLAKTKLEGNVQQLDVFRFLELYAGESSYDHVFADPPYHKKPEDPDLATPLVRSPHLLAATAPGGFFTLETHRSWNLPEDTAWTLLREKRYGQSRVWLLAKPE